MSAVTTPGPPSVIFTICISLIPRQLAYAIVCFPAPFSLRPTDTRRPLLRTDLCNSRHRDQTERCMHRLHPNLSMAPPHSALIFCFRFSDSFISTSYRTGISLHIAARSATLACTGIFSPFLALFFRGWFCRFDLVVIVRIYPPSFISGRSSFVFFFGFAEGRESGMDAASDAELIATME